MSNLYIVWSEANETGIPIIDEQHRGLASIINTLYFFMKFNRGEKATLPTLGTLHQYLKMHFTVEEEILRRARYSGLSEHIEEHEQFRGNLIKLAHKIKMNNDPTSVLKFLKSWWVEHASITDHAYINVIKEAIQNNPDDFKVP